MQQSGVANQNEITTSKMKKMDTTATWLPYLVDTSLMHLGSDTQRILPFLVLLVASKYRSVVILGTARCSGFCDIAQQLLLNNRQLRTPIIVDHCLCSRSIHVVSSLCLRSRTWIHLNQSWSVRIMFLFWIF